MKVIMKTKYSSKYTVVTENVFVVNEQTVHGFNIIQFFISAYFCMNNFS